MIARPSLADGRETTSAAASAVGPTCFVRITRSNPPPGSGSNGPRRFWNSTYSSGIPTSAVKWNASPSSEQRAKLGLAYACRIFQHRRNTGSSSPGDELMTRSTSAVAVCWLSDSPRSVVRWRNSLSSRVFSMAMTAGAAKCVSSSICLSVNERTSRRSIAIEHRIRSVRGQEPTGLLPPAPATGA